MLGDRVSPRQAAVVVPVWPEALAGSRLADELAEDGLAGLLRAALLDVIGALVRVDGVTLAILGPAGVDDLGILTELPAGIEVIHPGTTRRDPALGDRLVVAAMQALLERRFDRIVAIAGDVLRLLPRIVATALSSLVEAELVAGPTPRGGGYLIGVRDTAGLDFLGVPSGGPVTPFGGAALVSRAHEARRVIRRVEPLPRLTEMDDLSGLRGVVAKDPGRAPRVAVLL